MLALLQVVYKVGTMIEVPRAALQAGSIAKVAEFFSFGTNDLTQMTFGYSRDDIGKFLPVYLEKGILQFDPFQVCLVHASNLMSASCFANTAFIIKQARCPQRTSTLLRALSVPSWAGLLFGISAQ